MAATKGGEAKAMMVNDLSRAFAHAPATRLVYIELPPEDRGAKDEVGRLNKSLYGTRDASLNWQWEVSRHLEGLGFRKGRGFPSVFFHPGRGLATTVHGDDYVSVGSAGQLRWLKENPD